MKTKLTFLLLAIAITTGSIAQTTMNIYKNDGTVLQIPISTIDSITYTTGTTISTPGAGVTYNGYTYPTIVLGNGQEWMAQNLNTTQYNDGTPITLVTDPIQWDNNWSHVTTQPMMCWFNNDQATYTANSFGALYNWYVVSPTTNGNRNVCPAGWHVPTDAEWNTLIGYLDPSYTPFAAGSSMAGGKLKSTGTQYWTSPNTDATNESGFSGLPGGFRTNDGTFSSVGNNGNWWSSSESSAANACYRYLQYYDGIAGRYSLSKTFGFSVRCVKD